MSYSGENTHTSGLGSLASSPKPVETGKEYEVEVSEISRRGDGIARVEGFVIFVAGTKAGQKGKIQITSICERFAKAELI